MKRTSTTQSKTSSRSSARRAGSVRPAVHGAGRASASAARRRCPGCRMAIRCPPPRSPPIAVAALRFSSKSGKAEESRRVQARRATHRDACSAAAIGFKVSDGVALWHLRTCTAPSSSSSSPPPAGPLTSKPRRGRGAVGHQRPPRTGVELPSPRGREPCTRSSRVGPSAGSCMRHRRAESGSERRQRASSKIGSSRARSFPSSTYHRWAPGFAAFTDKPCGSCRSTCCSGECCSRRCGVGGRETRVLPPGWLELSASVPVTRNREWWAPQNSKLPK